ncbi:hypothetical protein BDA96_03G382100 [Sorghum bicolor]|uniref:DUF6598 domain-containing protein n=1 Tax=Sorghum bicolor TaxID=4558 RepID=A0A921RJV6_SORBI|nr:hypothetical protein BDA96_03G382100 [Sorghum bicolor]
MRNRNCLGGRWICQAYRMRRRRRRRRRMRRRRTRTTRTSRLADFAKDGPLCCPTDSDPSMTPIFSAMIAGIGGGFRWPLCVFGLVAIRDKVDHNRNIIFQRSRSECQTLTEEDPYLVLTGPARAVVFTGPVTFEVYLKVKGPTELEDRTLCCLAEEMRDSGAPYSYMFHRTYSCKFSTVEFTLGHITSSVEATISVRVISGSWPHGFQGEFAACLVRTGDIFHGSKHEGPVIGGRTRSTSVDHKKITLLSFGDEKVPVLDDGVIELSRSVVSAKSDSNLEVSVRAWQDSNNAVQAMAAFASKEAGRSSCTVDIGSCKMVVIVAWSLISDWPESR